MALLVDIVLDQVLDHRKGAAGGLGD